MPKKRKMIYNGERNGTPLKTIITIDNKTGEILSVMDKPNFKLIDDPNQHVSGCHMIQNSPWENHYDHFIGSAHWRERGDSLKYPYQLSGSAIILT